MSSNTCVPTAGAYAQGTVAFPGDDGRSFEITVHCVPETSLRWKLAHSTSIDIDPLDLTWTTLHAWDDDALLNEILGRIDNEIVLLGVTRTEDVAVSELDGEEHPSLTNIAVPEHMRVFAIADDEVFWATRIW